MKNLKSKLSRLKKSDSKTGTGGRITNETVAEYREQILAGGRKFKYPVQYSKHKLLINTAIISLVTMIIGAVLVWHQLYVVQSTSNLTYRVTQLLPLPVARVDGQMVRYSDYLRKYRSSIHFLETQDNFSPNTADGKRQAAFVKRQQLDTAMRDAYVNKLAAEHDVQVTNQEVDEFINTELDVKKVSQRAFERTVLADYYGWSMSEYRAVVRTSLLKRKVAFKIDETARHTVQQVQEQLRKGAKFADLAKKHSDDAQTRDRDGKAGTVTASEADPDGVVAELSRISVGKTTGVIQGRDGYYIAKLDEKSGGTMHYSIIKIALSQFDKQFKAIKDSDKTREYIDIEET